MRASALLETVLYAEDIAAAQRFYGGVLGLEEYRAVAERFAFFRCGGQMLLVFNPTLTREQPGSDGPPPHGATGAGHVCFRATFAEQTEWMTHLALHDVAIEKVMQWPGGGQSIYVRDPDGNSVEFAEARIWNLP